MGNMEQEPRIPLLMKNRNLAFAQIVCFWACAAALAQSPSDRPSFPPNGVVPAVNPGEALGPGVLASIYGVRLAPSTRCSGLEKPQNPPYPAEICRVQVLVGDKAAGLLYVSGKQINLEIPKSAPATGDVSFVVVAGDQRSDTVLVRFGDAK